MYYRNRFLFWLCEECADMAASKGHDGRAYGALAIVLTIGCGILSTIIGWLIFNDNYRYWSAIFYLCGSAVGAGVSWLIVVRLKNNIVPYEPTRLAPSVMPRQPVAGLPCGHNDPVWCLQCGKQLPPESRKCDACGADAPTLD